MTTQVRIKNLVKSYGKAGPVLHGIDLEIEDGEFVVLVGPSGCGKSTLLRMIAGLEEITSGEIWIAGELVNDVSPSERGIAMVFQDYALYPHMTVRENMAFGMKLRRKDALSPEEQVLRIQSATELLGLGPYLDRKPAQLSGGQRQRVAIGRALVKEPRVFLFDEPLSNLDAQLRAETRVEIAALHRKLGSISIYVTHDQVEAMTLADRLVVLRDGVIQQTGRPLDLYRDPANRFVASFLGTPGMNFLDGRLDMREGERVFAYVAGESEGILNLNFLHSTPNVPGCDPGHGGLVLGVRPESLRAARTLEELEGFADDGLALVGDSRLEAVEVGVSGQALRVEGRVVVVEPHGHEVQLMIQVGAARWVVRAVETDLRAGERCWLELERDELYWFDSTGARLRFEAEAVSEPLPVLALEEPAAGLVKKRSDGEKESRRNLDAEM